MQKYKENIRVSSGGDTHLNNNVVSSAKAEEVHNEITTTIYCRMSLQHKAEVGFHAFSLNEEGYADYKQYVLDNVDSYLDENIKGITKDWITERLSPEFNNLAEENSLLEEESHLAQLGGLHNG